MTSLGGMTSSVWRFLNSPVRNPITFAIGYWFKNEFAPRMPRKWKRLLYVASIIAMTSFTDKPDFMLFEKISRLLKMTYTGQTFWIPKFMRNIIWKPILQDQISLAGISVSVTNLDQVEINQPELEKMADYFMERTPDWIQYGPQSYMRNDLVTCLSHLFDKRFASQLA